MADDDDLPQADIPTPAIMQLEVINHNEFTISDFFDGVPITFPGHKTGEKPHVVTIRPDMALHCFGYPGDFRDMALHMAKRYGWSGRDYLIPEGTQQDAKYVTLARNIEIRPIYFKLERFDPDAPIPADDGRDPDDGREPSGDGPDAPTKVGKRKRTPAKLGGAMRGRRALGRAEGR